MLASAAASPVAPIRRTAALAFGHAGRAWLRVTQRHMLRGDGRSQCTQSQACNNGGEDGLGAPHAVSGPALAFLLLQRRLQGAVAAQRWEEATELREQMAALQPLATPPTSLDRAWLEEEVRSKVRRERVRRWVSCQTASSDAGVGGEGGGWGERFLSNNKAADARVVVWQVC